MVISREIVDDLTRNLNSLSESTRRVLRNMLEQIEYTDIADLRNQVIEIMEYVCGASTDMAAAYTADFYDAVRAEAVGGGYRATATSNRVPEATQGAVRALIQKVVDGSDYEQFMNLLAERADYEIKKASGECVMANAAKDPLKPRFARVPTGSETCGFCIMLASRGFVYTSNKSAGSSILDHYHANCDCRVVQGYDGMEIEGYDPSALYDAWVESDHYDYMQRRAQGIKDENFEKFLAKIYGKEYEGKYKRKRPSSYAYDGTDGLPSFKNFKDVKEYLYSATSQQDLEHRYSVLVNIYGGNSVQIKSKALKNVMKSAARHKSSGARGRIDNRVPITQEQIDDVLENELSGIRLTMHPTYNGRIKTNGKTSYDEVVPGYNKVKKIEIGKQANSSRGELIDSILHEELEARIVTRAGKLYAQGDVAIHEHIEKVIARYGKMKGLWDTH